MNRSVTRAKGISLIEVITVLAVILIIVGILFPIIQDTRERTLDVVCAGNMRALTVAMMGYLQDNDGRFSQWNQTFRGNYYDTDENGHGDDPLKWPIANSDIFQYTSGDYRVYVCPLYVRFTGEKAAWTYTQNWVLGPTGGWGAEAIRKFTQVRNPASLLVFAEESPWVHGLTSVMNAGSWDISGSGYYAHFGMNDGRIVSPGNGKWPNLDTMGTFHRPLAGRYSNATLAAPGYATVAPYVPKDQNDVIMNTGMCNVSFVDGHVRMARTTNSSLLMENNPDRVVYRDEVASE